MEAEVVLLRGSLLCLGGWRGVVAFAATRLVFFSSRAVLCPLRGRLVLSAFTKGAKCPLFAVALAEAGQLATRLP